MSDFAATLIASVVYKLAVLSSGTACVAMGYKLFKLGVFGQAGDFSFESEGRSFTVRRAAPGTVLGLFGAVVIGITVHRGFDVTYGQTPVSEPIANSHAQGPLTPAAASPNSVAAPEAGAASSSSESDVNRPRVKQAKLVQFDISCDGPRLVTDMPSEDLDLWAKDRDEPRK